MKLPFFTVINIPAVFVLAFFSTFAVQPSKKVTFLGVSASTLPQRMSEQMDLPAGAHLCVDQVSPNSPAEQAGLKLYDVLLQLDDQILINSSQLKVLVRMKKPGDLITLKLLRKEAQNIRSHSLRDGCSDHHSKKSKIIWGFRRFLFDFTTPRF